MIEREKYLKPGDEERLKSIDNQIDSLITDLLKDDKFTIKEDWKNIKLVAEIEGDGS